MYRRASKKSLKSFCTIAEKKLVAELETKSFDSIPGPKPLPLIGNLWRYFPIIGEYTPEKMHRTYAKMHEQYGPLVREKVHSDRTLLHVFDPRDMQVVYSNEGPKPTRISHRALAKYRQERPHLYSGPGLFPSNGDEWLRFRRLFQKTLLNPASADACSSGLEDVTDDLVAKIPSLLDKNNEVDLQPWLFKWAIECIGMIALNRRLGCLSSEGNKEVNALVKAAHDIHQAVFKTEFSPYMFDKHYKALEAAQDYLAGVVEKYVEETVLDLKCGKNTNSILAKLLEIADRKDVFTMVLDMFLAGIDTTAYTMAFCLYNLAMNQRVQDTLRTELKDRLPNKSSRISGTDAKLRYLQLVIKETLRVNPVAIGTGRILPTDVVLSGYNVPAGVIIFLQHQVACMQEKYFKDAHLFYPERWEKTRVPLVSSPFGYGPRSCIGMRFARLELYLATAKLIRNYTISYHHEEIDSVTRLINVPDKPLRLKFKNVSE